MRSQTLDRPIEQAVTWVDGKSNFVVKAGCWKISEAALMLMECDSWAQRTLFRTFEFDCSGSNKIWPATSWIGLVQFGGLIEIILAEEAGEMGEIVRKANTGVKKHGKRTTVLSKIDSDKEEGEDYPDLPVPGQRVDRAEAWEWVEDGVGGKEVLLVISDIPKASSPSVLTRERRCRIPKTSPKWEQKTNLRAIRLTVRTSVWTCRRHHLKDTVFRTLKRPIRRDRMPSLLAKESKKPSLWRTGEWRPMISSKPLGGESGTD